MSIKKAAFIVMILLTSMFAYSAVDSPAPVRAIGVTGTITLGGYGPVYDSGKGEIFLNSGDQTVVISDSTNKVVATINDGSGTCGGMAYDSGKDEIFKSIFFNGLSSLSSVDIISDSTDSVVATIPMGFFTGAMAYDSGKNEIFVAYTDSNESNSVWVISDTNNTVVAKIPIPYAPSDMVYDSGKGLIFTANNGGYGGDSVTVISDSNNTVVANIIVGTDPEYLAYDSGKGEVFVTHESDNTVAVISDATDSVMAYVTVGYYPQGIAYDSGRGEIYVANPNTSYGGNSVSVISDTNNTVIETIPNIPNPGNIAYDSGKSELFITLPLNDKVIVISDCPNLTSPTISAASTRILQGQTSILTLAPLTTGTPPYTYQWFTEAPNATAYTTIDNATLPSYNFTTTTSTAAGNWTFMLQVTDATGATVNSTEIQVTVSVPPPVPAKNISASDTKDLAAVATVIILASVVTAALLLRKKGREKHKTKENQNKTI